ncbi:MAG: hypothetical protein JSR86_01120 [Proteobacteria bacterium]|nr:hypothetical protein [Pseudomonadota bacterium]
MRNRWRTGPDQEAWWSPIDPRGPQVTGEYLPRREHIRWTVYYNQLLQGTEALMRGEAPPRHRDIRLPTPRRDAMVRFVRRAWRRFVG